jgi:hypothetical protein
MALSSGKLDGAPRATELSNMRPSLATQPV